MAIVVNHNLPAMNANRMLNINNNALSKSLEKLSSGLKINRAADDASGLSISEKMRAQVRGLDQASANSEDGVSLIQTADGALDTTEQMLQRMRELTVKGTTETLADEDLQAITDEMKTLAEGINQIAERTEFNTKKLLTGNLGQTTIKATASFTTDEATTVSGTNLTATAGKTVSAGTTVKLTSSYTTNATDSAVKVVAQDGDTKVKITSGASMTAGTTFTDVTNIKLNKDVQLEYIAGGKHNVDTTVTITAGASLTLTSGATGIKFDNTVKIISDTGATVTNSAKATLTAGSTIKMSTTANTTLSGAGTIKAGATGANIKATAAWTLTAGTTIKLTANATSTKFSGRVVDVNTGIEYSAGATLLTAGGTYKTLDDGTTNGKATIIVSANGTITRTAGSTYDKDSAANYTVTVSTRCIADKTTKTVISAGGTVTRTANSSITAGNTIETITSTKINTTGKHADINVAAGGTVTVTAGKTVTSNDAQYSIKTIYDGTTLATAGATAYVSLKEGESVTVTAGRTLSAGTSFQLGVDKQFDTDAKVSGDKLSVSAGTTITAGTSYDTNNDMVIQTGANAAQVTKFTIGNMAFSAITTNNTGADITKTDTTYGTAAVTYEQGACIVASAITTETACSQETLLALDVAINAVSTQRSKLGAVQNQLEYTIKNLDNTSENLSSAESRIRDTDMAKEMMNYTKYNILSQASQSMLAQANQQPQSVLSLLQ